MRGLFSLLYGVAAYAIGVAALLYLIGFLGNLFVPTSVDVGPVSGWPLALTVDVLLVVLFGLQHSVMARPGFKQWWTRIVPPAVERSTYLLGTAAALACLFTFWLPMPAPVIWQVSTPLAVGLLWAAFGLGWVLLLASTFLINHFELFGLHQVYARLTGRPMPQATFKTPLLYRHVRHPIYLGLLLGFWCTPRMTLGHLVFALAGSVYILVGIWFEERDLVAQFGDHYRRYREQVGMLLPLRGRT